MHYPRLLALALACAAATPPILMNTADAQTRNEARKSIEASMVLTGTLDISSTGAVEKLNLDKQDQVDPTVVKSVNTLVAGWAFEPVLQDGRAVRARAPVRLRVLAQQNADGGADVSISSASFDDGTLRDPQYPIGVKLTPPRFPEKAFRMGGVGEVTLLVQVGRDGTPKNVAVERVNLRVLLREHEMRQVRDMLGKASADAAKRWQFAIPTEGELVDEDSWTVRVPVDFAYADQRQRYGKWQAYVPGPKATAEWAYKGKGSAEDKGDLLAEGGVYMAGISKGPKLLTPLRG